MTVLFRETRETIDLLRRVVDKLDETNGCISAEELWEGVLSIPSNVRNSKPTIARHGMRQMEGLADALQSFASTLVTTYKSHISTTRRLIGITRLTVESLPNEIFMRLLRTHSTARTHIPFSNTRTSPDDFAALYSIRLLCRSAELGLSVNIELDGSTELFYARDNELSSESVLSRLSMMFKNHQRWKNLTMSLEDGAASFIQENFPVVNHKAIRVLRVVESEQMEDDFFQCWKIPLLEELEFLLDKQSRLLSPRMASQTLRICTLRLYNLDSAKLIDIAAFLNTASNLRSLKVDLTDIRHAEVPEIRLSYLEHLNIRFDGYDSIEPAANLLKAILCPGLKCLSVMASTHAKYSELTENIRERYLELTSFTLVINRELRV